MNRIVNIAAYQFLRLDDLKSRRERLLTLCKGAGLKGTILLSVEGINLFVAGEAASIELLLAELRSWPGLEGLQVKVSETDHQPFSRMLVRIKKEIIAFGVEGIDPARRTSPKLAPAELKQWLDEGRPVTLLDTRNDYEVKLGTFHNALPIGIDHFRDFPEAVSRLPETMKETPIVMFCTGGIRCEKAGPFMESVGFKKIYQLDGGILRYFEDCGGSHYDGECFVFDQRVGVDPALHETESTQCYQCQSPLTEAEQKDARYVPGKSCPYCFVAPAELMHQAIAERQEILARVTSPLPGSVPYDNLRPMSVPVECDGWTLGATLTHILPHVLPAAWEADVSAGLLINPKHQPASLDDRVRAGQRYFRRYPGITEPDVNADITVLHEDEALIVLNKPAPLPMHSGGRFHRNTLQYILGLAYHPQKPRPAHRLDANTTGVLLLTRTRHFASRLQPQFTRGEVEKVYLARVQGHPVHDTFSCDAPIGEEAVELGAREIDATGGQDARTEFLVRQRLPDGTALLEVRPLTGRTNQIRIHLWHLGFPVCGDAAYLPDRARGDTQTLSVQDAPLCLHAWKISFRHPITGEPSSFEAPPPPWWE